MVSKRDSSKIVPSIICLFCPLIRSIWIVLMIRPLLQTELPVSLTEKAAEFKYALAFVRRTDLRNVTEFVNAMAILSSLSVEDWRYNQRYGELLSAAKNFVFNPRSMNEFQQYCPESGYTSSPDDGLLAGFTEEGRMSSLFYPHTGFTQQIPYLQTGHGQLNGSKPREGAFLGYRTIDGVDWLWKSHFEHRMTAPPQTGLLHLQYRPHSGESADGGDRCASDNPVPNAALSVDEYAYVIPETETLARDFSIKNNGQKAVRSLVYYMQANANDNAQYPVYQTNRNRATAGDELRWSDCESDVSLRTFPAQAPVIDAGVANAALEDIFDVGAAQAVGSYLGGYLELDVDLQPGEEKTITVFTTGQSASALENTSLRLPPEYRRKLVRDRWGTYLSDVSTPSIPSRYRDQYLQSIVGLLMLYDPESGSLSAAPNSQPAYYSSWPRDGSFIAIALAEAGLVDPAQDYLGRFCASVQESDGSFEQCYASTGESTGIIAVENDQQVIYIHAVRRVFELSSDDRFLCDVWPTVKRAADYTVRSIVDNGLLAATHDFAEMWTDARQSLWTNTFAYRGLLDAAVLAEAVGTESDAERYREMASVLGTAIEDQFFVPVTDGFATHLSISGRERNENTAFAVAIHPTGWAEAYDHVDELLDQFESFYQSSTDWWLPREFLYASALYDCDRLEDGDTILDDLMTESLPGGTLAERVTENGEHRYAALGWSNAGFVHALYRRAAATSVEPSSELNLSGDTSNLQRDQ